MSHPKEYLYAPVGRGRFQIMEEAKYLPKDDGSPFSSDDPVELTGCYSFWFFCPGCEIAHKVDTYPDGNKTSKPGWTFDGNYDAPTFSPSLLVRGEKTCHSFIQGGRIQFLSDCSHPLAGQTVDLPLLPDWLKK